MDVQATLKWFKAWVMRLTFWPFVIAPITTVLLILAPYTMLAPYVAKKPQEALAIPLAGVLFAVSLWRAVVAKRLYVTLLCLLCLGLFFREIHFDASAAILVAIMIGIAITSWVKRDALAPEINDGRIMGWLVFALFYYGYSQFCARRGFQFLPNERFFHESLEEGTENLAHLVMMIAVMVGSDRPRTPRP